jgi:hypothetical protein
MNKFLILALSILPLPSLADDSFDLTTGILHIPDIVVGTEHFTVDAMYQGDLIFEITSVVRTSASGNADSYDPVTATASMPRVLIETDIYDVTMQVQPNQLLKVTAFTKTPLNTAFHTPAPISAALMRERSMIWTTPNRTLANLSYFSIGGADDTGIVMLHDDSGIATTLSINTTLGNNGTHSNDA